MSWPAYVAALYAEHKCQVTLLVICPNPRVAKWARVPIAFGTGATLVPTVLGPEEMPLGPISAHSDELEFVLAVLRTAMHAGEPLALQNAMLLGAEVLDSRPEHDDACYLLSEELFGSEFSNHMEAIMGARSWYDDSPVFSKLKAINIAEGEAKGKAEGILAVLRARRLPVSAEAAARVQTCGDLQLLDTWLTRAVTVTNADDIF